MFNFRNVFTLGLPGADLEELHKLYISTMLTKLGVIDVYGKIRAREFFQCPSNGINPLRDVLSMAHGMHIGCDPRIDIHNEEPWIRENPKDAAPH